MAKKKVTPATKLPPTSVETLTAPAVAATAGNPTAASKPPTVLESLGIIGFQNHEPVILGALISGEPLLLIGPHGTGKSYLLARLAESLGLSWRHYNASLLNFDDLVGFPMPDANGTLRYVQTPSSIWDAQVAFVDEISRCRPDLQNKLFPIIHERRVQGILLDKLVYRWSAMNPPPIDDAEENGYLGSEPLDAALADRFAFVVAVPPWNALTLQQKRQIILVNGKPADAKAAARLQGVIQSGQQFLPILRERYGSELAIYVQMLVDIVARGGLHLSARRAGILLRNILAVHAARVSVSADAALSDSAFLAVTHSIPQRATGEAIKEVMLLAAHREAWAASSIKEGDPRQLLLLEHDPIRRVLRAGQIADLPPGEFSAVVADALVSCEPGARHALARHVFESELGGRLIAAIADQCAGLYAQVATPCAINEQVTSGSARHRVWQAVTDKLSRIDQTDPDLVLLTNLLTNEFTANHLATEEDVPRVIDQWQQARTRIAEVPA